jgi:diamine N-acetyltransferase
MRSAKCEWRVANNRIMNRDILSGERIRLRAVEPGDVDVICRMENDTSVWHVGNTLVPFSRFQIEQYAISPQHDIHAEKQLRLMIEKTDGTANDKIIGAVDLYDFDPHHKRAGIGILIHEREREKGYASDSLELMIRYAFEILMLHQLYCSISPDNIPSLKLFEKHGFVKCGIKKEWRLRKGEWMDEIMYQLINPGNH